MRKYAAIKTQSLTYNDYTIVPIREEDKYVIMHMRNEQIFHLRQKEPLTVEQQDHYFASVISPLFEARQPPQILFSFLHNNECIGYGGLVHINWLDRYAEISFIIKPELEENYFAVCWQSFLHMIQQVAFDEIKLHKIFTYSYDLRPKLYPVVESSGFYKEAILKEHCFFEESRYVDVVIHSKINTTC